MTRSTRKQDAPAEQAAEATTVTVYHPTFPSASREVPADSVESWQAAGWRKTPLKG